VTWQPDYEAHPEWDSEPFSNRLVAGVVGRTIGEKGESNKVTKPSMDLAQGYVEDNLPTLKPKLKQPAYSEPLPQSIIDDIRASEKAKKKAGG